MDRMIAQTRLPRPVAPRGLLSRLMEWDSLYRQRQALRSLDRRMLDDIGLRRADAEMEARRSSWPL